MLKIKTTKMDTNGQQARVSAREEDKRYCLTGIE